MQTYYLIDRTESLSLLSGSGSFTFQLARGVPWSVQEKKASSLEFDYFRPNLFTGRVRDLIVVHTNGKYQLTSSPYPHRCIAGAHANTVMLLFFIASSDVFIALR